jgi:hypothetical protein
MLFVDLDSKLFTGLWITQGLIAYCHLLNSGKKEELMGMATAMNHLLSTKLKDKVWIMKSLLLDIGDEVEDQNKLLWEMHNDF